VNAQASLEIVPLDRPTHDRAAFTCGKAPLDRYLREQANQDAKRSVAATFIAVRTGDPTILGYYTLSQSSVVLTALPPQQQKRLPRYPDVPVTVLGRLAVSVTAQRAGVGSLLLGDACRRAAKVAEDVASTGVMVDAIDDDAVEFYRKFDFAPFPDTPRRLFLPMKTILDVFAGN
jgi:GNAT superfamily N-acetyltransferase